MSRTLNTLSPQSRFYPRSRATALLLSAALGLVGLTACGNQDPKNAGTSPTASSTAHQAESDAAEVAALTPRIAYTYDGGIQVRDATTLELVKDLPLAGFNRINSVGNGRDLMVSTAGAFQVLDLGVWQSAHGDHAHYYAAEPILTDQKFTAQKPGHVVGHDGLTALFDDGTGQVSVFESAEAQDPDRELRTHTTPSAHHGVAVPLEDDVLVISEGTADGRTGALAVDGAGKTIAQSDQCPGLHGEGVAQGEAVAFGCADGALVYKDGKFTKLTAPAPAGATSSLFATEASPVILGDYELEGQPNQTVALIDTAAGTIKPVALPSAYYGFNDMGRLDDGAGLVLGLDGKLHVIDVVSATVKASYPVLEPWTAPAEWQDPAPKLLVLDGMVYITDPAGKAIHVVDPETGSIWKSVELDVVPLELQGVSGDAEGAHEHGEHGEEGEHGHEEGEHHDEDGDHDHEEGE
jgi:hypothetical protein